MAEEVDRPTLDYPAFEAWGNVEHMPKLIEALAKARAEFTSVLKTSENEGFKRGGKASKYADLSGYLDATVPALSKHGLVVVQLASTREGRAGITTLLLHSSGAGLRGFLELPVSKQDAHGFGGGLTYCRRYSYAGILSLGAEDDDGNTATGKGKSDAPETTTEVSDEPKPIRLAGIIKRETEAETAWWYALETLDNGGVVEVKVRADKATDDGRLAEKVGYLVELEVLRATRAGKPVPDVFVLVGVLGVRQPEQGKPSLASTEHVKSHLMASKGRTVKPVEKASEVVIDKSMNILLQQARKRTSIPDADYYAILQHEGGVSHGPDIRVVDFPKILKAVNDYRLTVTADDINLDAEPA